MINHDMLYSNPGFQKKWTAHWKDFSIFFFGALRIKAGLLGKNQFMLGQVDDGLWPHTLTFGILEIRWQLAPCIPLQVLSARDHGKCSSEMLHGGTGSA